jgi:hypothetical protein
MGHAGGAYTLTVRVTDSEGEGAEKPFTFKVLVRLLPPTVHVRKVGATPAPGRILDYFIVVENVSARTVTDLTLIEFLQSVMVMSLGMHAMPTIRWQSISKVMGRLGVYPLPASHNRPVRMPGR